MEFIYYKVNIQKDILQKAQMLEALSMSTPIIIQPILFKDGNEVVDPKFFQSRVRSLQYLTFTQPDIQHAINQVCQHF